LFRATHGKREEPKGGERRALQGHGSDIYAVAFSPDGKRLASGSNDRSVRLWDVATGATLRAINAHREAVYAIAFSPDGRLLATGGRDGALKLWDVSAAE
jgi:WD40 repeat protein